MKIVKDFKGAGLVFVEGDGYKHRESCLQMIADAVSLEFFSEGVSGGNDCIPTSFAWRTNTGVKPGFRGLIDWERDDGDIFTGVEIVNMCWALNIIKWRPHLPQIQTETPEEKVALDKIDFASSLKRPFESKPVYTQAMCDAGELPMVGVYAEIAESTDYLNICYESGKRVKIYAHFTSSNGTELAAFVSDDNLCGGVATGECFKPIKTEREKQIEHAIDKMLYGRLAPCNMDAMRDVISLAYDCELLK